MENTIYYTFSTISQTLAGALGLLAAFMIIRVSAFNQLIYERIQDLHNRLGPDDPELSSRRWRGDASAFFSYARTKGVDYFGSPIAPPQQRMLAEGEALVSRKTALLREVAWVLGATAACIVLSFVALSLTKVIICSWLASVVLLAIGVLFAGICVALQVRLVLRALREA